MKCTYLIAVFTDRLSSSRALQMVRLICDSDAQRGGGRHDGCKTARPRTSSATQNAKEQRRRWFVVNVAGGICREAIRMMAATKYSIPAPSGKVATQTAQRRCSHDTLNSCSSKKCLVLRTHI